MLGAAAFAALGVAPSVARAQDSEAEVGEEEIIVTTTRSGRRVQDEPIRVEVIGREEIEEKLLMTPGNIATLVNETGGVRVQVTSPALGAANIRMQGMSGRYTSLLADGLPLYGGSSSIGVLQIPPTDLGRVEVIKGAASALYGPAALGGVINLVSRRPEHEPMGEVLFNATSRNGQDVTAYGATPLNEAWSASLVGGYHSQSAHDLDDDGWLDIPSYERVTLRPRLFWDGDGGATAFLTVGAMKESRDGGTREGATAPDGAPFRQTQDAQRFDIGGVAEFPLGFAALQLRGSAMRQDHGHRYGADIDEDTHDTLFTEAALAGDGGATTWLAGVAFQHDRYRSENYAQFNYDYDAPALFAQLEHDLRDDLTLAASGRVDVHNEFGTFFSPRVSALYKPGNLSVRASLGQGFYAPTPFVEEIEAAGLSRLAPLEDIDAETATTASLDLGYHFGGWETNVTLFASDLEDAVRLEETGGGTGVALVNVDGVTRTRGAELLLRYRWDHFVVTGSYVYVDASEPDDVGGRRDLPVTPRQTAGFVAMWEDHDRGRVGFEAYYTGAQALEDNPYRSESQDYLEVGLLGEIVLGNARLFLNVENLLDVRQTDYDPLLLSQRAADGRWTVDAWGPLEGMIVNGGVRLRFGGEAH